MTPHGILLNKKIDVLSRTRGIKFLRESAYTVT